MAALSDLSKEIDETIARFAAEPDNLILILHAIQNAHGYVPRESALLLSSRLSVPLARIYEVLTFYHYFRTAPPGGHSVVVCHGTSCWLNGSTEVLAAARRYAKEHAETSVSEVRCVGCCGLAPLVFADKQIHTHLDQQKTTELLVNLGKGER
ncbi:MAG: NAD(P)H-dependent oxidoreductase subunit E [Spirochaetota bacterium]